MEFIEKSAEELEKLDAEGLAAYYKEQNNHQRDEIKTLIDAKGSKEDIDSLKEAFQELKDVQFSKINEALIAQGVVLKKLSTQEVAENSLTFGERITKGLTDNIENLKQLKNGGKKDAGDATFRIKAAGDMTILGNISGGNVPVEQRLPGVNEIARRRQTILDLVMSGSATSNVISWVEEQNEDGSPAGTVEGTAKNQIDFDLVVVSENVKKRTAFIKVSTEMLDDVDFINSKINNTLLVRLSEDIENQVLNGDNTGQNLNGAITQATAFSGANFTATVLNPNEIDVLTVAANEVEVANHSITAHVMHPVDVTKFLLTKATDEAYVGRILMVGQTMLLDGFPIIKSTAIAQGDFLTANFLLDTLWSKGGIEIEVGLDGNDFTKNMRTILAEWRGLNLIEGNDTTAFVEGTFSTAKTAIAI